MKTVTFKAENPGFTFVKRFLYSFQVLMVGVAIPFFFLFGISDGNHKKEGETIVKEITNSTQQTSDNVYEFHVPGI